MIPAERAYVLIAGAVNVTTIDEDNQDVVVDQPARGDFFGLASMLDEPRIRQRASALEETTCLEVDRQDIYDARCSSKPHAGMDMLSVLGRQFHAAQQLVRCRAARNPNEIIESESTFGERVADAVAGFGGSWTFIITFRRRAGRLHRRRTSSCGGRAWDPYPFILLNLFLSMLAALQAPVIMMSQNRQDTKDRLRGELDFEVNRRAETEIQGLARKFNQLQEQIGDIEELLRARVSGHDGVREDT